MVKFVGGGENWDAGVWYRSARGGEGAAARQPKLRIPALGLPFTFVPGPKLEVRIF